MWFSSYLSNRQQRVRVKNSVSTFKKLNGAMPQGSRLGPLAFLVFIDDLSTGCPLHKYVDDITLSELVQPKQPDTHMSTYLADLLTWAVPGDPAPPQKRHNSSPPFSAHVYCGICGHGRPTQLLLSSCLKFVCLWVFLCFFISVVFSITNMHCSRLMSNIKIYLLIYVLIYVLT